MQTKTLLSLTALTLLVTLTVTTQATAQETPSHRHKKYRLIDLGTFGGPSSAVEDASNGNRPLNGLGIVVGDSETQAPLSPTNNGLFACHLGQTVNHAFVHLSGVVSDLGALSPSHNNCSIATNVNNSSQVVGTSENGLIDPLLGINEVRAVLWTNRHISNLGTLGGNVSLSGGINNLGQVVGTALNPIPDPLSLYGFLFFGSSNSTQARGFLWQDGHMHDLGTLGGPDANAIVINENGQVAGESYTNSTPNPTTGIPTLDPYFWDRGRMTDLGTLGGVFGLVNTMNSRGQVVGFSNLAGDRSFHAFLATRGGMRDLGTLGGSTSEARWINEAGDVVGGADLPGDQVHDAFLWRNGRSYDLGNLGLTSFAHANNNHSQVVGASLLADGVTVHAFLWEEQRPMVDLNDLIPQNSDLTLASAEAINDAGVIAGNGLPDGCNNLDDGCRHAFLLVPESDCDSDNETRIADRQAQTELMLQKMPGIVAGRVTPLNPAEWIRNQMRQHYRLPGVSSHLN